MVKASITPKEYGYKKYSLSSFGIKGKCTKKIAITKELFILYPLWGYILNNISQIRIDYFSYGGDKPSGRFYQDSSISSSGAPKTNLFYLLRVEFAKGKESEKYTFSLHSMKKEIFPDPEQVLLYF